MTRHNAGNSSFADYGGSFPLYQGGEFFKFYFNSRDLLPKPVQASAAAAAASRARA